MADETKHRILDAAERLFADFGFAGTSLRAITTAANVNLAAVHYHFKSKEALLEAVVLRRGVPLNEERLRLLDQSPPTLEGVLEAFVLPTFRMAHEHGESGKTMVRMMGRLHGEGDHLPAMLRRNFPEVGRRFSAALVRLLPHLSPDELMARVYFGIGAMAFAVRGSGGLYDDSDPERTAARLVRFMAAGLRAPGQRD